MAEEQERHKQEQEA